MELVECDPWPPGGRLECGADEAHFPGRDTCTRIGPECPADGVPVDLPPGAIHVRAGASGGDGSLGAPFGTIADALGVAGPDAVLALASGSYPEMTSLRDASVTLVGACMDTVIETPPGTPAFYSNGSSLTLRNLRVHGGQFGFLVQATAITLEQVIIEDLTDTAIAASNESTVNARDLVIRRNGNDAFFLFRTDATFERVVLEDIDGVAFGVRRGTVTAREVAVDGLTGSTAGFVNLIGEETFFTLEQASLTSDPLHSLFALGSSMRLVDVVITGPPGAPSWPDQLIILATAGATLELERVTLIRGGGLGLGIGDPGTRASITDFLIRDLLVGGHAFEVGTGAIVELERVWIERSGSLGMLLFGSGTEVTATDLNVRGSRPDGIGLWGRGIGVQEGASLTARRVEIVGNHELSVTVASPGTRVTLSDVSIRGTLERACAPSDCPPRRDRARHVPLRLGEPRALPDHAERRHRGADRARWGAQPERRRGGGEPDRSQPPGTGLRHRPPQRSSALPGQRDEPRRGGSLHSQSDDAGRLERGRRPGSRASSPTELLPGRPAIVLGCASTRGWLVSSPSRS